MQQQAWLSCPLAAPSVAASIVGQQFHQQIHQNTLPKQDSTLANRAGLVRMWLGKQGQAHVIPLAGSNSNVPIPQIIMPQVSYAITCYISKYLQQLRYIYITYTYILKKKGLNK